MFACSFSMLFVPLSIIWKHQAVKTQEFESSSLPNPHTARLGLYIYLRDSKENYCNFAEYLGKCFALENLEFFEKCIVLKNLIEKYYDDDDPINLEELQLNLGMTRSDGAVRSYSSSSITSNDRDAPKYLYLKLKFGYLKRIYREYTDLIEEHLKADSQTLVPLHKICHEIYHEFVAVDAPNQINISSREFHDLHCSFQTAENFNTVHQYFTVFDKAMIEVWKMLSSIFKFQYKSKALQL